MSDGTNTIQTAAGYTSNQGWILKFDLVSAATEALNAINGPYAEVWGIEKYEDNIYAFGYYYNAWNANSTNFADVQFGNSIILSTTADTHNNKGDAFLAVYNVSDMTAKSVENIVYGTSAGIPVFETTNGGSTLYNNTLIGFGRSNAANVFIYGNEFTMEAGMGYNNYLVAFNLTSNSTSIENDNIDARYSIYAKNEVLYIEYESMVSVEIYGLSGVAVMKSVYPQGQDNVQIPLSGLSKGIYLVKVKSLSGEMKVQKMMF